jgi:hypothetical protein
MGKTSRVTGGSNAAGTAVPQHRSNLADQDVRLDGGLVVAGTADVAGAVSVGNLSHTGTTLGFYGTTPATVPTVAGFRDVPESALANLLTALADLGLIVDSTEETET